PPQEEPFRGSRACQRGVEEHDLLLLRRYGARKLADVDLEKGVVGAPAGRGLARLQDRPQRSVRREKDSTTRRRARERGSVRDRVGGVDGRGDDPLDDASQGCRGRVALVDDGNKGIRLGPRGWAVQWRVRVDARTCWKRCDEKR